MRFTLSRNGNVFAVLELDHPISVVPESLVIGSKFDTDIQSSSCRIAFKGNVLHVFEDENYFKEKLPALKVFKIKQKVSVRLMNLVII